jgi:hypothetical protein
MELSTLAKLVTLLVLVALFVGVVLVTPRIWKAEADPRKGGET